MAFKTKTYLEIEVPIKTDAVWISCLKKHLSDVHVNWQNGYFHITVAFIDRTPDDINIASVIDNKLRHASVQNIQFDKLDAFTIPNGNTHLVYLTAKNIPEEMTSFVDSVRAALTDTGCLIQTGFKLHVTLGRVFANEIDLPLLQQRINNVAMPTFTLQLKNVNYREFRGSLIKKWHFKEM